MHGNLYFEQPYVLDERFAGASKSVIATVDRIVSTEEIRQQGVTIPAHVVQAVAEVPFGAHPASSYPNYTYDRRHVGAYVRAASTPETAEEYLDQWVRLPGGEEEYRTKVGADSLAGISAWSESLDTWKGLFA
jgi:glutaconate CoA-transferase subunit A